MSKKAVSEWKEIVKPALGSKRMELLQMGYSKTTDDDIWNCLVDRVWQGDPKLYLHEVVQDILHLSSSIYMNYFTISTYQNNDLMKSISALLGD